MTLSESDKVTVTLYPPLPSRCCVCNFSADGKRRFMDFQMSLDVYGAVSICEACIPSVAAVFDYIPSSTLIEVNQELIDARDTIDRLENENGQLNRALDSLLVVRPYVGRDGLVTDERDDSAPEQDDRQLELPISESGESNRRSAKSATVRGPKNISQSSLSI